MIRSRVALSQQTITSPPTPITRLTRWPPPGNSPIAESAPVRPPVGVVDSSAVSQPPGSLKTTMSPREGPLNQYDGFSTRIRSDFTPGPPCNVGYIEPDGT